MWTELPVERKEAYKSLILNFASLSPAFSQKSTGVPIQTLVPIVNSKFQETAFQNAFNATIEDIGNTSYDASMRLKTPHGETKYLIGIKTFGYTSGLQKIAQFKANYDEWNDVLNEIKNNAVGKEKEDIDAVNSELYLRLAHMIAKIRNERINSSVAKLRGFRIESGDTVECVYHVLMPANDGENPTIYVGETSYDPIDIEKISVIGCSSKTNPTNFSFTDGNHTYRFTSADSQLLMDFSNRRIAIESWKVVYMANAFEFFSKLGEMTESDVRITESVSWKITNKHGEVERYSGFNAFYGVGSKKSKNQRMRSVELVIRKYEASTQADTLREIKTGLLSFLLDDAPSSAEKLQKELLRDRIMQIVKETENSSFETDVAKMLYRPIDELYIPIPDSKKFHQSHPDFFADGAGTFKADGSKLKLSAPQREFNLMFEPSGDIIRSFITQDNGKAIESCESQAILGKWILRDVFQLCEYEPLTSRKLDELNINGLRLYRTNKDNNVHVEFIHLDENNLPNDYWH